MGFFNLGKKKSAGWDEEAATKFHSEAPGAKQSSEILSKGNDTKDNDGDAQEEGSQTVTTEGDVSSVMENSTDEAQDVDVDVEADSSATQTDDTASTAAPETQVEKTAAPRVSATPIANIHNNRTSDAPKTASKVEPGTLPKQALLDRAAMDKFIDGYSHTTVEAIAQGGKLENYVSGVLLVVQDLNSKLLNRQKECIRLTDKLAALRTEIDLLEQNAPEFDKNLRQLVENLNVELTKDYVEGVARVEIPQYGAANELVEVISVVGQTFAKMLPALETSKEGALGMLQSLTPESKAFGPAKELVDFSIDSIESIKRFLKSHVDLRNGLQSELKNYDLVSAEYKETLGASEANLTEMTHLVAAINEITDSFQHAGELLHKAVPES